MKADNTVTGLRPVALDDKYELFEPLILPGESLKASFKGIRDRALFTDKRLIILNVKGLTGKKKEYIVVPYSKISSYSIETAGSFDLDSELKFWVSGLGGVQIEFLKGTNIMQIAQLINSHII